MIDIEAVESGQTVRSALSLALLTGRPVRLRHIRARRQTPGLRLGDLGGIEAAARIGQAEVTGAMAGSQTLSFAPRRCVAGDYSFSVPAQGSVVSLLLSLLLPLSFAGSPSRLRLAGATHAPHSPCYQYFAEALLPLLEDAGLRVSAQLLRAGFSPRGGGMIVAGIRPVTRLAALKVRTRGALLGVRGYAVVAGLDRSVAERQRARALRRLEPLGVPLSIEPCLVPAVCPGAFVVLFAEFEHSQQCYWASGTLGRNGDAVADEAVEQLLTHVAVDGALDPWQASQLVLPLAFAQGRSSFSTCRITPTLCDEVALLREFLAVDVVVRGRVGEAGQVHVQGARRERPPPLTGNRGKTAPATHAARRSAAEAGAAIVAPETIAASAALSSSDDVSALLPAAG
ncbi:RNA 3'-phosphate cyclase [Rhodocyclus tenuis]|uniref:RNA 3'-terminal phosphate cyclase n=1 Tax=Rhodocyclus gracilis TaxID=2929842 RepID=A0ABX0WET1_9RHOO|nr:RNA 3'-terminal phosphate cyclase [Rhodocyclus gracilis]NJA88157.1 RNA 3'-phosphate cyclase [Rhodocyclus gracilis]